MKKIFASILFITAFITLIFLGTWQLDRLAWKTQIIKKLDREYQQAKKITFQELEVLDDDAIRYGTLKGNFLYDREILVGPKPLDGEIGYQVITPLQLSDNNHILVNRGWIGLNKIDDLPRTHSNNLATITGLLRIPDWNKFTPDNSPANNIWTKLDIKQIANVKNIQPVSKFMLYATEVMPDTPTLKLQNKRWYPRNKHQQYAFFWFTMAGVLVVLLGLFVRQSKSKNPN